MRKLLKADLFCLFRNRVLRFCMTGAFVFSSLYLLQTGSTGDEVQVLDEAMMQTFPFLPILYGAFVSLFIGLEYQDGTMRNKLISGHPRWKVYGAYLITSIAGCLAILFAWGLSCVAGMIRFGWFRAPAKSLLLSLGVILCLTASIAAILTLLGILVSNRAVSGVAAILLIFGMIALGSYFYNALSEPEFASAAIMTGDGFQVGEPQPNPGYISGTLRTVYQFAVEALPTGQAILLANQELEHPVVSLAASFGILVFTVLAGSFIYTQKDLK